MCVGLNWETEGSSQTEICQLNISMLINQEVLRLQITMHHSMSVAIGCSLEDLISETLDFLGWERSTDLPHVLFEVIVTILEDQIELIL